MIDFEIKVIYQIQVAAEDHPAGCPETLPQLNQSMVNTDHNWYLPASFFEYQELIAHLLTALRGFPSL